MRAAPATLHQTCGQRAVIWGAGRIAEAYLGHAMTPKVPPETLRISRNAARGTSSKRVSGAAPTRRETERNLARPRPLVRNRPHVTLLTGPSAGELFALTRDETVLGRDDTADLAIDDPGVSRRHARIVREKAGDFVIEDLDSTNGTYVGADAIAGTRRPLRPGDQIQLGPNVVCRFAMTDEAEERLQKELFESSVRDPLTQAYNRRHLDERMAAELAHARRHRTNLAVLLLDIDHFKEVNDRHGHLAGDSVLRQLASTVAGLIRVEDFCARFGGEEFVVLTRGDSVKKAARLAERLRRAIGDATVKVGSEVIAVTVSIGVVAFDEIAPPASPEAILGRADERLYRAKQLGRNRVEWTDA
jgi:two-component system, cell cycle response regulator